MEAFFKGSYKKKAAVLRPSVIPLFSSHRHAQGLVCAPDFKAVARGFPLAVCNGVKCILPGVHNEDLGRGSPGGLQHFADAIIAVMLFHLLQV